MSSVGSGPIDFETASAIRKAAAGLLNRLSERNVVPLSTYAAQVVRSILHRNHGFHECREDFYIYVEENLWNEHFHGETEGLNEVEKGEVRLAVRAYFQGKDLI